MKCIWMKGNKGKNDVKTKLVAKLSNNIHRQYIAYFNNLMCKMEDLATS